MVIKARINGNKFYNLVRWNAGDFNTNLTLYIQSMDLQDVTQTFTSVNKIEIFKDDAPVATYTSFDTYSAIAYLGKEYVEGEQKFADTLSVTLTKTNLVDQVQRLDEQINEIIDVDSMTLEELRNYKLGQISKACRQDIYDGDVITLEDGTSEKFTFNAEDQENTFALMSVALLCETVTALPWHSTGICKMYSRRDIITISATLLLRKTQLITYCNALNIYVRSIRDRDELMNVSYGMELPDEYLENVQTVLSLTITEMEKFMRKFLPDDNTEPSDTNIDSNNELDDNGDEQNIEDTEGTN